MTMPLTETTTEELAWDECVQLLTTDAPYRVGSLVLQGRRPFHAVLCMPRADGSVLIPTGRDARLAADAVALPSVEVRFEGRAADGRTCWRVRGTGQARPLARRDRPPANDTSTALAVLSVYQHGVRVRFTSLSGERVSGGEARSAWTADSEVRA